MLDAGDGPLFRSLESQIVSSIPQDTCEWKRSYGRSLKNVRIEAAFQPFDIEMLEKFKRGEWSILEHPVLHVYVTECNVSILLKFYIISLCLIIINHFYLGCRILQKHCER